jgi:hypothetical protein
MGRGEVARRGNRRGRSRSDTRCRVGVAKRRPNPLVRGGVAFNLADLAIAAGDTLLLAGACVHARRHRDRLHEPV